jgi:hypothetical protein
VNALTVGEQVPPYVHKTGPIEWARYAAINGIYNDMHHDDEAGRRAGNAEGAFGQGNLIWSYLFNMVRAWAGTDAVVRKAECQFRGINQKDDIVTCTGVVKEVTSEGGVQRVTLTVEARNQRDVPLLLGSVEVEL